jgi:hypothetical protein
VLVRDFRLRCVVFPLPHPFGKALDTGGQMPAIGAERHAQPIGCGFLFRRRMEVGEVQHAIQPLVPVVGE